MSSKPCQGSEKRTFLKGVRLILPALVHAVCTAPIRMMRVYGLQIPRQLLREGYLMLQTDWYRLRHRNSEMLLLAKARNLAHMLDKNLRAEQREPNRAREVHHALVRVAGLLETSALASDQSYLWAKKKLDQYKESQGIPGWRPALQLPRLATNENQQQLLGVIRERRSIRSFSRRPIPLDILRVLAEAAACAPSSCNRQSTVLHATLDADLGRRCLDLCAGATCFGTHVPCFVSVCSDMRVYPPEDRGLSLVDASLGVQNLLLAAHVHGIGGTVLNWFHATARQTRQLREMLEIPAYQRIVCNIVLGYPSHWYAGPDPKGCSLILRVR